MRGPSTDGGEDKAKLVDSGMMFTDLFHLVHSLEHDYREENGERVHAYGCRRCALTVRLSSFREDVLRLARDIEFAIGEPVEKKERPSTPAER